MTDPALLRRVRARLVLGLIPLETLSDIATTAMTEGWDSPSLRTVAGLSTADAIEAGPLLSNALKELGVPELSKREAVIVLADHAARQLLTGQISPIEAARRIWDLSLMVSDEEPIPELDSFVYAASEWGDRPQDRGAFEAGIVEAAQNLIDDSAD